MAVRAIKSEGAINHYGAVRLRLTGTGNMRMTLYSLSDTKNFPLTPLVMAPATNIEPTKLTDFTQQRARLELTTTAFDENFECSKIVIFIKPVAEDYPR